MRRPLKPFVTEYKGSPRRQKEPIGAGPNPEPMPDTAWGVKAGGNHAPGNPRTETNGDVDSYEAAMRAADALFTRTPAKPQLEARARPVVTDDQPFDPRDVAEGPKPASELVTGEEVKSNGAERMGRILRVIDEPSDDPFARMEAERAPKKRGRKPGSKNKPKPALTVVPALETNETSPVAAVKIAQAIPARPAVAALTRDAAANAHPSPLSAYKTQRYSWVRKRLGPGEQWKRNLPKVIW